ncbi:hypothetical protein, partial [Chryseobacterium taichungense]|uniref:hypothetical protein n=1 Tax=Chryseobacterium taichungense TaxID=295069 RepID=UPI0028A8B0F1
MKTKLLNTLLIISSLLGYLEWGTNNHSFIFESEWEIILKIFSDPISVAHPFVLIPLVGQVSLVLTLFQKNCSKILTILGISLIGILFLFLLIIGILSINPKIIVFSLPFLIVGFYTIIYQIKS